MCKIELSSHANITLNKRNRNYFSWRDTMNTNIHLVVGVIS